MTKIFTLSSASPRAKTFQNYFTARRLIIQFWPILTFCMNQYIMFLAKPNTSLSVSFHVYALAEKEQNNHTILLSSTIEIPRYRSTYSNEKFTLHIPKHCKQHNKNLWKKIYKSLTPISLNKPIFNHLPVLYR